MQEKIVNMYSKISKINLWKILKLFAFCYQIETSSNFYIINFIFCEEKTENNDSYENRLWR